MINAVIPGRSVCTKVLDTTTGKVMWHMDHRDGSQPMILADSYLTRMRIQNSFSGKQVERQYLFKERPYSHCQNKL